MSEHSVDDDVLLTSFSQADFDQAHSKLLERYQPWQGLLISNDEQSVITPDDLPHLRSQARKLLEKPVKIDYEQEQLKILTVLVYLLISGEKTALPSGNRHILKQLEQNPLPNADHYIMRKIINGASSMEFVDIERLVNYQNRVLSSYAIDDDNNDKEHNPITLRGLGSADEVYFNLQCQPYKISIELLDQAPTIQFDAMATPDERPVVETHLEPLVLRDTEAAYLADTLQSACLRCGVQVAAACYIGVGRERNEDGIVVHPQQDEVIVIDAMGGYGNGVTARDIMVSGILQNPGNLESATAWTRKEYDTVELKRGGVCLIGLVIQAFDDYFSIELAQAGDVHAVLYDQDGKLRHETTDEAIGHKVINAIISENATHTQRTVGWSNFGELTRATVHAKPGWRLAVYSDGVANHFNAEQLANMILNTSSQHAIETVSTRLHDAMSQEKSYRDNSSLAIIDFQ